MSDVGRKTVPDKGRLDRERPTTTALEFPFCTEKSLFFCFCFYFFHRNWNGEYEMEVSIAELFQFEISMKKSFRTCSF